MTWLWWSIPLVIIVYLFTLNELLRGRSKETISGILVLSIFLIVGIAFFVSGWLYALGALLGSFILTNLLRPFAIAHARRLIDYPDIYGIDEWRQEQSRNLFREHGSQSFLRQLNGEKDPKELQKNAAVESASCNPAVTYVLGKYDATLEDLATLYDDIKYSFPPQLCKIVLENPAIVEFFLCNSEPYENSNGKYDRKYSEMIKIKLHFWIQANPGGSQPI